MTRKTWKGSLALITCICSVSMLPVVPGVLFDSESLTHAIRRADFVGVLRIQGVDAPDERTRVASATVLEVWKGEAATNLKINVVPSFACDVSEATEGETVIAILGLVKSSGLYRYELDGIGRLRIETVGDTRVVRLVVPVPKALLEQSSSSSALKPPWIRVSDLHSYVNQVLKQ